MTPLSDLASRRHAGRLRPAQVKNLSLYNKRFVGRCREQCAYQVSRPSGLLAVITQLVLAIITWSNARFTWAPNPPTPELAPDLLRRVIFSLIHACQNHD